VACRPLVAFGAAEMPLRPSGAKMSEPMKTEATPGRLVTVAVLLVAAMTIMANATIAPSLPGLKAHFSSVAGIETLSGLILSLPSLAIVLTAGLAGWLADRVNRQWLLTASGVLYAIGGTSGLWAVTIEQMLVGRFILGVGVAGTMTLAMTWGADLWQGAARARFLGFQGAAMSAGGIVVMLLGGAAALLHWRGAFAVYLLVLPVVVVATVALAPYVAARTARAAELARSPRVASTSLFPWGSFAFVGPLAFLFMAVFYVLPTRLPVLMDERGITNALVIAAVMAGMTLAAIPGALMYGRIRAYASAIAVFGWSYVLMGLGILIVALADGVGGMLVGALVMGAGMGPSMPNYTTYFMASVPPDLRGRASGLLTTAFFAGQFASPLISAPLVVQFGLEGAFEVLAAAIIVMGLGLLGYDRMRPVAVEA
ncbi:MAG: MFS transporter, partial [Paracoccaceae bacterium]